MKKENMTELNFGEIGLSPAMLKAVQALGFEEPTPVQKMAIPIILSGRNLLAQAPTGTGKTLAFGLPLMQAVKKRKTPFGLILVPTRELCIQVAQELNKVGMKSGIFTIPVYGGQSISNQIFLLRKGVQVVVGTPGRIIDHIERGTLNLAGIGFLVLDEADEMLDMGFEEDIERILKHVPKESQRMLFSATMPEPIMRIARKYIEDYERVSLSRENIVVPNIKQIFYEVRENDKLDVLTKILDTEVGDLLLIFCHTKKETDEVAYALRSRGYQAEPLHGDYSQSQRERVMDKFRKKKINILVATDVAARGIDVTDVSHVINYSIPQNPESYIHRIGRTGRAGKEGVAVTFVTPREYRMIREIEKVTKSRIRKTEVPELSELLEIKRNNFIARIRDIAGKERKQITKMAGQFAGMLEDDNLLDLLVAAFFLHAGFETPAADDRRGVAGMKRLLVTIGKNDRVEPKDIFKTILDHTDIKADDIGRIRIQDKVTFVEVREDVAEAVLSALDHLVLKGKRAKIMRAGDKR